MRRRDFLILGGAVVAALPLAARAQQPKLFQIGVLFVGNAEIESFQRELREELGKVGYVEGRNIFFEYLSAEERLDRLPTIAAELVAMTVDVIVALYASCALVRLADNRAIT